MTALTALIAISFAADLRSVDNAAPNSVAEPIRKLLEPTGIEWQDGTAKRLTIWLRREIPAKASEDQIKNGLTYREWVETSLIGLVTFHEAFIDYRKQEIAAGTYTMRIVFQPDTGDHKETAPHTEFLLLSRVEDDRTVEDIEVKTVVERSRKSTGGDHPGVMLLVPVAGELKKPTLKVIENVGTAITLPQSLEVNTKTIRMNLGIIVAGSSAKR